MDDWAQELAMKAFQDYMDNIDPETVTTEKHITRFVATALRDVRKRALEDSASLSEQYALASESIEGENLGKRIAEAIRGLGK